MTNESNVELTVGTIWPASYYVRMKWFFVLGGVHAKKTAQMGVLLSARIMVIVKGLRVTEKNQGWMSLFSDVVLLWLFGFLFKANLLSMSNFA